MFKKLVYKIRKPCLLIVQREKNRLFFKALNLIAKNKKFKVFSPRKKGLRFYIENSRKTILVVEDGNKPRSLERKMAEFLKSSDVLIKPLHIKQIKTRATVIEYGLEQEADLSASDLSIKNGFTNLKLNYQGNSVPLWLTGEWKEKEIEKIISTVLVSLQLDVNLVDASQALKNLEKQKK